MEIKKEIVQEMSHQKQGLSRRDLVHYLRVAGVLLVISLPFLISLVYQTATSPKRVVRFGGGPVGGRYDEIFRALSQKINSEEVQYDAILQTKGSYENVVLLNRNEIDFGLFQSGADGAEDVPSNSGSIRFVANVFPEVTHLIVSGDLTDQQVRDRQFSRVAIGIRESGDFRVGKAILEHLKLAEDGVQERNYDQILQGFQQDELDLAVVSVGIGAEIVQRLINETGCRLVDLPFRDGFLGKHIAYASYDIPARSYDRQTNGVRTAAVNAQLITHERVSSRTVQEILRSLTRSRFLRQNRLSDLYQKGNDYARMQPEFDIHPGAMRFYDPAIEPLINPDFVEATEGIRSFVFSGLIGLYFLLRWMRMRKERSQEHKLDQYIRRLINIEQEQKSLDQNYTSGEMDRLEKYLDEITDLRKDALEEFTAHQLNDDPAIECFINMSHALSEKIGGKLTRDVIRKNANRDPNEGNH